MLTGRPDDAEVAILEMLPVCRSRCRDLWDPDHDADEFDQALRIAIWRAWRDWRPDGGMRFDIFVVFCARRAAVSQVLRGCRGRSQLLRDALDHRGWDSEDRSGEMQPVDFVIGGKDPLDELVAGEEFAEVVAAAVRGSAWQRRCLAGRLNGESYQETAAATGRGTKAVDNALRIMRERVRAGRVVSSAT